VGLYWHLPEIFKEIVPFSDNSKRMCDVFHKSSVYPVTGVCGCVDDIHIVAGGRVHELPARNNVTGGKNEVFIQTGSDDGIDAGCNIWCGDYHVNPGCKENLRQRSNGARYAG